MLDNKKQYQATLYRIISFTIILGSFIFLIWRAKYGFCFNDEPFLISLAQRLYKGDALIAEEWHGVQNFGALVLPIYSLFRLVVPSTEGMLLIFRYLYCILWFLTCLTVFFTLLPKYKSAIFAFIYLILFSPHDYMTLSYNTFGLMALLLICCIIYRTPNDRKCNNYLSAIIFSLLWIVSVLSTPYMAVPYVLTVLFVTVMFFYKRNSTTYLYENLFFYTKISVAVIAIIAVFYLYTFVLSRTDISTAIECIPRILADPEHPTLGVFVKLSQLFNSLSLRIRTFLFFTCFVTIAAPFIKKYDKLRYALFTLSCLIFLFCQLRYTGNPQNITFNEQMFCINILGLTAYGLIKNKDNKLFFSFYIYGFIYSLLLSITSNTYLMATALAITVSGVFSVVTVCALAKEILTESKKCKLYKLICLSLVAMVLFVQLYSEANIRVTRTFFDSTLSELNTRINHGVCKGLYTAGPRASEYERTYINLHQLLSQTDTEGKTFFSCTSAPYIYLDADLDYGTFSAWSFGYGDSLNDRITEYISVNKHKTPDLIFAAYERDILPITQNGYSVLEYNGSYLFVKQ